MATERTRRGRRWIDLGVSLKLSLSIFSLLATMTLLAIALLLLSQRSADRVIEGMRDHDRHIVLTSRWLGAAELWTERMAVSSSTVDADLMLQTETAINTSVATIAAIRARFQTDVLSAGAIAQLRAIELQQGQLVTMYANALAMSNKGDLLGLQRFSSEAFHPAIRAYMQALARFASQQETERDDVIVDGQRQRRLSVLAGGAAALLVFACAALVVRLVVTAITRPLAHAIAEAERIGAGQLGGSTATDRGDEFGRLLNAQSAMSLYLRGMVAEVRRGVDAMSVTVAAMASGSRELAQRTEQAAASLEETASSMEQLTATVQLSAEKSGSARQFAASSTQAATQTGLIVQKAVSSMARILASSRQIANITSVIDGLAFQTNILALNAAVEAARAGEQGRGFAVVAAEVRSLAQRSTQAAREIAALVTGSVASVEEGAGHVTNAGIAIDEIVASIRKMAGLSDEITQAASEQHQGIAQINEAIARLDQMTQQNMSMVQESAAASVTIDSEAQLLSAMVRRFDLE